MCPAGAIFKSKEVTMAANVKQPTDREARKSPLGDIYDMLELVLLCAVVIILVYTFLVRMTVVNQHSMELTLEEGDYTVISDLFYTPKTGDIVVVQNAGLTEHSEPLVKRVIAVGGDTLNINYATWTVTLTHEGKTEILDESDYFYYSTDTYSRLTSNWCDKTEEDGSYTYHIPEGYLFVMGDNRNVSADSRMRSIGLIPSQCVVGKVLFRLYPFAKFGAV